MSSNGNQIIGGLRVKGKTKVSYPETPLISVITPVLNGEQYLEQAILSVLNQSYKNIEYIIIDGGSTDKTLDIVKKYDDQIDYWVSEADAGIYDAMNKGISLCTGEIIGIIASDDWYEKETVNYVVQNYLNDRSIGLFHGIVVVVDNNKVKKRGYPKKNLIGTPFKHPTCFISKQSYNNVGVYNTIFKVVGDYDLMLRIKKQKIKTCFIDKVLAYHRTNGFAGSYGNIYKTKEKLASVRLNGYPFSVMTHLTVSAALYYPKQFIKKLIYGTKI